VGCDRSLSKALNQAIEIKAVTRPPVRLQEMAVAPMEHGSHQLSTTGLDNQYVGRVEMLLRSEESVSRDQTRRSSIMKT
jgi:hypothetical protein